MKKIIFIYFFTFLLVSCQSGKIERFLIGDFNFNIPLVNDIDDLLGKNARTIQLDTITEALVGNINKIIKQDNNFFILSGGTEGKRILHFDNTGKFISSLDKRGGGPGEYTTILDFNVYNQNGNTELWICDFKRFRKYVLSDNSWNLAGNIDFDFVIHKFKIISDEHILLVTGQNEESLMLADINGKPLRTFLKKEIPFLTFKFVEFVNYNSYIVFQLGPSNEGVAFCSKDFSFEYVNIANNKQFLSSKNLLKLFDRFGQAYLGELSNTNCIRDFGEINDTIWLEYFYHGVRFVAVSKNGVWKKIKVDIKNNFPTATFGVAESNDSFILHEYPEDDNLNLILYEYIQ